MIGLAAVGWGRTVALAESLRPRRWGRFVAPVVVFVALGLVSIKYPELLGNGKGVVQLEALGRSRSGCCSSCLCSSRWPPPAASERVLRAGLFTPTLTIGVLLAGVLGTAWTHVWPGAAVGSYAIIGGGAFLAAAMQGPLSGLVLVLELTRNFDSLMAPTLLAVTEATVIARRFGAPSIYSARLRPDPDTPTRGPPPITTLDRLDPQTKSEDRRPARALNRESTGRHSGGRCCLYVRLARLRRRDAALRDPSTSPGG